MKALAAEAVRSYRLSAAQVGQGGNILLGFWIESVCCIKPDGLKEVAEKLMMEYEMFNFTADYARALRLLLMLGCHSRGRPTIDELCDLKYKDCKRDETGGAGKDFAGPFQYFNDINPHLICKPVNALGEHMIMTMRGNMPDTFTAEFCNRYLCSRRDDNDDDGSNTCSSNTSNVRSRLDADQVREDLEMVLERCHISTEPSVDAVMHATFIMYWLGTYGIEGLMDYADRLY